MKRGLIFFILILAGIASLVWPEWFTSPGTSTVQVDDHTRIIQAFENQQSDVQVLGSGRVSRLLSDDNEGSRHQRFIVELSSGHTLLISHNIDLAPRIDALRQGDQVSFYGEYEWNPQGGVVHWTHHDPRGRHPGGWIDHAGVRYE